MKHLVLLFAFAATPALAGDAGACTSFAGFNDACNAAQAGKIVVQAKTRLNEIGDCSQFKKKKELASCAAEVATIGNALASAAGTIQSSKPKAGGGRASRANSNRMEAEESDE